MTTDWNPDMLKALHEMVAANPRPSLTVMGERLGVDPTVVMRYCHRNGLPTNKAGGGRKISPEKMFLRKLRSL